MTEKPTQVEPSRLLGNGRRSTNGDRHLFRRGRPLRLMIVGAISVIAILAVIPSEIQKWLWMKQLSYAGVFWTLLSVRWELSCVAFAITLLYLWINLRLAARNGDTFAAGNLAGEIGRAHV